MSSIISLSADHATMPNDKQLREINLALAKRIYTDDMVFMAANKTGAIYDGSGKLVMGPSVMFVAWDVLAKSDQDRYLSLAASAFMFMRERIRGEMERSGLDIQVVKK